MQKVLETGTFVPDVLKVPDDYEDIYISGNLHINFFPIFFDAGFHDINTRSSHGLLPLCFADYVYPEDMPFIYLDTFLWLKDSSCLDQPVADPMSLGLNPSAGWHYLALKACQNLLGTLLMNNDENGGKQNAHGILDEILKCQVRDTCRCRCSPHGCLPMTLLLKLRTSPANLLWAELLWQGDVGSFTKELFTLLTFEALEMTHTCCSVIHWRMLPAFGQPVLKQFLRDVLEVQDEEKELGDRLTSLLSEFQCRYDNSRESLRDFVYGYWAKRMAEECIPSHDEIESARHVGVNVKAYKTPYRLKCILGRNFDFTDYAAASSCSSDDNGTPESREGGER
ncbi:hypothetical protein B0T10DRAFT_550542 [Thelonectria olida]|uniref:Uncharacterized protein n=1 Tax=Thelonectria olida TaxID=1576542 RepID=A0A9P8VZY5_9HYPO|nr:hypothetical protein B0T10DRAFT_550542 [Thelonectria olida]